MQAGFLQVPDWFSTENEGCGIAVADLAGNGTQDLVVFMIDHPQGQNRGLYRVGRSLDANGNVTGGWTGWIDVPHWFSTDNQGGGIAVADLNGDGTQDLVVFMIDNPPGVNRGVYQVGRSLDANGNVTGGWTGWIDVPNWFSWENQGGGIALADLNGDGTQDLVVFVIDNPPGVNRGVYQVGRSLDVKGNIAGGWTGWIDVPDWFSWENQGAGVAVVNRGAENDLVVFAIDNPPGQNQAFYRIMPGVAADGTSEQGWSSWLGVPNWFSWENQGGSIAPRVTAGQHELAVLMVDHPVGQNAGLYRFLPLDPASDNGLLSDTSGRDTWRGPGNWRGAVCDSDTLSSTSAEEAWREDAGTGKVGPPTVAKPPGDHSWLFCGMNPHADAQGHEQVFGVRGALATRDDACHHNDEPADVITSSTYSCKPTNIRYAACQRMNVSPRMVFQVVN